MPATDFNCQNGTHHDDLIIKEKQKKIQPMAFFNGHLKSNFVSIDVPECFTMVEKGSSALRWKEIDF